MKNLCQHLTVTQRDELLKLLQRFEEFFDETLGTCKTDPVFEFKDDAKPICSQPYPETNVHEEMFKNRFYVWSYYDSLR